MGAVKNFYHDQICEEAHRREERGDPDEPRTCDSGSRRDGEDPRSGAEAEGRQNGSRSEIARDLPA